MKTLIIILLATIVYSMGPTDLVESTFKGPAYRLEAKHHRNIHYIVVDPKGWVWHVQVAQMSPEDVRIVGKARLFKMDTKK